MIKQLFSKTSKAPDYNVHLYESMPVTGNDAVNENNELAQEKHDLIKYALELAPFIKGMLGEEFGIYVSDLKRYLFCEHGIIKLSLQMGDMVKEASLTGQCLHTGQRIVAKVEKDVYGAAYIGTAYPITDPDTHNVVGVLAMIIPSRQEDLITMTNKMETQINAIAMTTTSLSTTAEELATTTENLNRNAQNIKDEIKSTDDIVTIILNIAEQTHLLGLNAAIEAARVGNIGKGFNVVAGEIRKLSQSTQGSVKEIMQKLQKIKDSILDLTNSFDQISAGTQQQAASVQEINAAVNELASVAMSLKAQANDLIK